jgi:hypothetical protein
LKGRQHVALPVGGKQWNLPAFVLERTCQSKPRPQQEIRVNCDIVLRSALREELTIDFPESQFDSDSLGRAEPICAPDRLTLCRASQPCAHQFAVVGVSVEVLQIAVVAAVAGWEVDGTRRPTLNPQVNLRNLWQAGQIKTALERRFVGSI